MLRRYKTGNQCHQRSSLFLRRQLERRYCYALKRRINKRGNTRVYSRISPISESILKMMGCRVAPAGVVDTEMMEAVEVGGEVLTNRVTSKGEEEEEVEEVQRLLLDEGEDVVVTTIAASMMLGAKCNRAMPQESHTKTSHHFQRHIKGSRPRVKG